MGDQPGFQLTGSAPERYERYLRPIMAPFVAALVDAAGVGLGASVLDVACGTGFVARAAAGRVGPAGRVAGTDLNPGMLEVAAAASEGAVPTIEWRQAPADQLPFPDDSFDAVLCQQGLQFFPDLDAAVAEAGRVTREGGRVAGTVWLPIERSPYMGAQRAAIEAVTGPQSIETFSAAFACSPERLSGAFAAAGLGGIEAREVAAEVRLPGMDEFFPGHLSAIPWGAAVAEARPDGMEAATSVALEQLAPFTEPDGSVVVPFAAVLVAGRRLAQ